MNNNFYDIPISSHLGIVVLRDEVNEGWVDG